MQQFEDAKHVSSLELNSHFKGLDVLDELMSNLEVAKTFIVLVLERLELDLVFGNCLKLVIAQLLHFNVEVAATCRGFLGVELLEVNGYLDLLSVNRRICLHLRTQALRYHEERRVLPGVFKVLFEHVYLVLSVNQLLQQLFLLLLVLLDFCSDTRPKVVKLRICLDCLDSAFDYDHVFILFLEQAQYHHCSLFLRDAKHLVRTELITIFGQPMNKLLTTATKTVEYTLVLAKFIILP